MFSMKEYFEFEESVKSEVDEFRAAQSEAVAREEARLVHTQSSCAKV